VAQWRTRSLGGDLGARPVSSSRGLRILGPMRVLVSPSVSILVSLLLCFKNSRTSLSMYLFCNLRIHVITLYSGHVSVYYASMLRCWHLVWILVRTDHPCLGVGCYNEGICGTHQLTHKMKWLLQRVGFYWSTMLNDCFRYYKGCES
jgi:hypothetical protein